MAPLLCRASWYCGAEAAAAPAIDTVLLQLSCTLLLFGRSGDALQEQLYSSLL